MFKDISIKELFTLRGQNKITLVDVRSPSEFKDGAIPGSINIPVFDDKERKEVGTLYKQVSPNAAKDRGIEIFSKKLPAFIKEFSQTNAEIMVYCWRGGMRSKIAATMVDLVGIPAYRLQGGFRTYRNWVVQTLDEIHFAPTIYVLNGFTGTGKTKILNELKNEGYPVIDLESMANHRGSIFGQIGLNPNNQKTFDSLLIEDLLRYQQSPFVLMEGESKRIGKIVLPEFLIEKKKQGVQLFIDVPIEERVQNILEEYQPWYHHEDCLEAFHLIKKRIHTPVAKEIDQLLEEGNYHLAVRLLLEYYYDLRYEHSIRQYSNDNTIHIKAQNIAEAVEKICSRVPVTCRKKVGEKNVHSKTTYPI